jgi:hypothetical protein
MVPVGTSFAVAEIDDCADFIAQFGEIGRKNRRRDE